MFISRIGLILDFDKFMLESLALVFSVEVSMLQQKVRSEKFAKSLLRENKDSSQYECFNDEESGKEVEFSGRSSIKEVWSGPEGSKGLT